VLFDAYFEVSRFEVLISRFFWACFSKPPDLHVMGVGRSDFLFTLGLFISMYQKRTFNFVSQESGKERSEG